MDLKQYHKPQDVASIRSQEPFERSSLEQNVWVVLWQALIPAFGIASLCLVGYFIALEWITISIKAYQVLLAWVGIFLMSFISRWNKLLGESNERLWKTEEIINKDIDGDGHVGPPEQIVLRGVIEDKKGIVSGSKHLMPFSVDKFMKFCKGVGTKGLTYRAWTGRNGVFSDSEFEALMTFLLENNFARWVNEDSPNQGRELTRLGKKVLEEYRRKIPEAIAFR